MEQLPVKRATEAPDFIVDEDRGALLNTNMKGLQIYRQQRMEARKNRDVQSRMDRLEASVDELKALLIKALNK